METGTGNRSPGNPIRGPEGLRRPFARFGEDYRATGRFYESLDRLEAGLADPVGDRIVESLRMARDVGGTDLGRLLRTLSAFLREDARTRAELETRQGWTVNAVRSLPRDGAEPCCVGPRELYAATGDHDPVTSISARAEVGIGTDGSVRPETRFSSPGLSDRDNGCESAGQVPNDTEQPALGIGAHAVIDPRRGRDSELCRDEVPGATSALGDTTARSMLSNVRRSWPGGDRKN
jgi:hypothetical protein